MHLISLGHRAINESDPMNLCLKITTDGSCLKVLGHSAGCDSTVSVWNNIGHDPLDRTKKKIIKAGFATPRGGDKGGYQNHVSRSSRVIIPFEHATKVDFTNYEQGATVRVTVPQALELLNSGDLIEVNDYLQVKVNGEPQRAFLLYRSSKDMENLPVRKKWVPCGHRVKGKEVTRRNVDGEDFGHYLARIPRGLSAGIQQGIFAPEYVGRKENYACQVLLTYFAYKTIGHKVDSNYDHVCAILEALGLLQLDKFKLKGILNASEEVTCPLCMRPIEFSELHEAIDPSQVPGLANSGVQLAETRSTLVNLYHLQPLLYDRILGHTSENIAWGHAHCNTFLSQRKSFSLEELKLNGKVIPNKLYADPSGVFIRSEDNRAWVSVTPIEPGNETFTAYLRKIGAIAALAEDEETSED
jgi:hypothetical protein